MKVLILTACTVLLLCSIGIAEIDSDMDIFSESVATVSNVAAGLVNPAGLGYGIVMSFRYMHSYSDSSFSGDNGFLLATRGNMISIQWMKHTNGVFRRKYLASAGKRLFPNFYWGISYAWFSAADPIYKDTKIWKIGFLYHPQKMTSLGLVVDDLNAPSLGDTTLHRLYTLAGAIKLARGKAILSIDSQMRENEDFEDIESVFRLEVNASSLIRLVADYQTGGFFHVGLALKFDHIGFGSGSRFSKDSFLGGNLFYNQEPVTNSR
ncbi:MAG: hypothetical protein GY839_06640 [candidate division Zixibacteria bacterium]|nr:hypothetical protein [candidate division Zixibacteria bacterium]